MNVLIIEDEQIAAERLAGLLPQVSEKTEIAGFCDSVKSSVKWFAKNQAPDLILMDIRLADGLSFEIFKEVEISSPIIFTTAYDQYAVQAFKVNSIDYLLKPISLADLKRAMDKFEKLTTPQQIDTKALLELMQAPKKAYKERFVIKVGEHLKTVQCADVEAFYTESKTTYLKTVSGQQFILDHSLDQLEDMIDPGIFFRINRKFIVHLDRIRDIISFSNSRLKIVLDHLESNDLIVARERVNDFRAWLDR